MINFALVGVADDRHRLFVHPVERRRAGVRAVGFSEPDERARADFSVLHTIPAFADHRELLATAEPTMVAVAAPAGDTTRVIIDALAAGVDVIVAPPVTVSAAGLDSLVDAAADSGRRLAVAHTYRNQAAVRLAREMIDQGRLGRVRQVILDAGESVSERELAAATLEALDLFRWFTGVTAGSVTSPDEASGLRQTEDVDEQVIMRVDGRATAGPARYEVVRSRGLDLTPFLIQVTGDRGTATWEVDTGNFRSVLRDRTSPLIPTGLPDDPSPWVLTDLVRRPRPTTTAEELWTTRIAVLAGESARQGGSTLDWRL
ncbi:Gfo/Idh/MocA family protein [Microlunatus speluncae]|uniref:Gfo/Idh/MocA family protein n=1 Tax=Microlunatus speluncae TaxID=2594267 RepID=UPI00126629E1|nr:Gfo/Idh/MocA family oxidoreductase [Microlunatus speluncae]